MRTFYLPLYLPLCPHSFRNRGLGVLDELYTQLSPLSGVAIPTRQALRYRMDTVPAYVDWRACTATPLSRLTADCKVLSKTPATGVTRTLVD
jgi:hypothetical protein